MDQASKSPLGGTRTTARAFFVADRLNTSGLERGDVLATTPLAFRVNENGVAILFRYGVVVLIGLNALEEDEFLRSLQSRMTGTFVRREEEIATIELAPEEGGSNSAGRPDLPAKPVAGAADPGRRGAGEKRRAGAARTRGCQRI